MEELLELRKCIKEQRYPDALLLIGELEEMSREDKISKIYSYAVILLLHLIRQEAGQRSTRSLENFRKTNRFSFFQPILSR